MMATGTARRPTTAADPAPGADAGSQAATGATVRATTPPEIVETFIRDGLQHHRIRDYLSDGEPHDSWAAEPIEPVARVILDDRYDGLMGTRRDATKLLNRLDAVLQRIAGDLTRRSVYEESAILDGEITGLDVVMDIDGLEDVIRAWFIERAARVAS